MQVRPKPVSASPARSAKMAAQAAASRKDVAQLLVRALKALAKHPDIAKRRRAQGLLRRVNSLLNSLDGH